MQTTSKNKERRILMLMILFTFISIAKPITNPTKCIRSCNGTTINYPFGFSENCEFPLNCTSNGRMEFKGYDIKNITWNSIILSLSPNCSRPINQIQHLYGRNYALTAQNSLLLQNCVTPLYKCVLPNLVESRFSKCKGRRGILSCYTKESSTTLRYEDVIATRCQSLFSSVVVYDSDSWVEFQAVEVGWWLTGTCRCHPSASCSHVGDSGFRCRCRPGFTGDGFIEGEGCRHDLNAANFGNYKIGECYSDQLHNLSMSDTQNDQSKSQSGLPFLPTLIIGVISLVGVILSLIYFVLHCWRKHNKLSLVSSSLNLKSPFLKVSYDMLLKATDGFSKENLVGVGRFGSVYKGVLDLDNIMVVAIKIISLDLKGATKSFMAECETLRITRHRNLLKIVTACSSVDFQGKDFKALVYEFMPNGNLQQWIHVDQHERTLSLLQRINIAIDVACALDYLHNNCDIPIIHCDLKPSNILLDNDMVAHVGDFGLARFHLHVHANNSSSLAVKGSVGYVAPEYGLGSMVSEEGDIYSYVIVLLEMMTAKTPTDRMFGEDLDLHKYAKSALLTDQLSKIIDPRLLDDSIGARNRNQDENLAASIECYIKCIKSSIKVGLKCSVKSPLYRITVKDAINELQGTKDKLLKELRIINRYMYSVVSNAIFIDS